MTKQCIWIGQGWGSMTGFYCGDPIVMDNLKGFLNATRGKPIFLTTLDEERICEYEEIGDHDKLTEAPSNEHQRQYLINNLDWPDGSL